jgi:hypothetical protein
MDQLLVSKLFKHPSKIHSIAKLVSEIDQEDLIWPTERQRQESRKYINKIHTLKCNGVSFWSGQFLQINTHATDESAGSILGRSLVALVELGLRLDCLAGQALKKQQHR